jgi:hypothetical protein
MNAATDTDAIALDASAERQPGQRPWDAVAATTPPVSKRWSIAFERAWRWEFWPAWLFYIPIIIWILMLGLRYRKPTAFTAANPGIDSGGVVGERKHQALDPLQRNAPDLVPEFMLLSGGSRSQRLGSVLTFAQRIGYPVVLKPDVGARGRGVFVARNPEAVRDYLHRFEADLIVQRYASGEEFGVFVARRSEQAAVEILSIVNKTFPSVTGDGQRSLRQLILDDARAKLIADTLFKRWITQLEAIPPAGETIKLVEIGSHCRGSLFLDARHLATPELKTTLERLLDAVPGYQFGRIDLRAPSAESLQRGDGLQVLELNGVTSESAHIYHPGTSIFAGYAAMFRQWSLAFAIGAANARAGAHVTGPFELLRLFREDLARGENWF